ncbi:hypothetical protein K461DRAFT_280968 [Myriangium duriaei CBS 260.36]|uniref:Uncharacterized protein n=1 Tax=Myriangium duriaei CBS 260.36 TaxID=1168546 RepID=A0A9P4IZQ2_9PEZI|nr:hypothetical protein K461DRAFT_280968 [Myriangium duriaei CBS 260.36]
MQKDDDGDYDSLLNFYSAPPPPSPAAKRMPVYLLHGFKWPRPLIRIHIILQNLDDAAAEWLIAPVTTEVMTENFWELYPTAMEHLPSLRFIEQYDPTDESMDAGSQPYAYVADVVHEIKLGLDVDEIRGRGVSNEQWGALLELRDKLAPDEKVGWFVVVCGDTERVAPPDREEDTEEEYDADALPVSMGPPLVPMPQHLSSVGQKKAPPIVPPPPPQPIAMPPVQQQGYEMGYRPRTAGSTYTSSSGTRKEYSSPDLSRTSHSISIGSPDTASRKDFSSPETPQRGFKKLLGSLSRRKSRASIRDKEISSPTSVHGFAPPVPPLPRQLA